MSTETTVIFDRCDAAAEDLDAYQADPQATRQERMAATTCQVLVDGLRTVTLEAEVEGRWLAVLRTLESLHLADTVGRPASHVYRTTYRILAGRPGRTQEA